MPISRLMSPLVIGLFAISNAQAFNIPNPDPDPLPSVDELCAASTMMPVPENPAEAGPWTVGSRTVTVNGLTTEVFYPATAGSEQGTDLKQWDIRQFMPASEAAKIPDAAAMKACKNCYPDLPVDSAHGPYPVLIYVHGTAATRIYSLPFFEHWASRGFIVISADNPGITQKDILESFTNLFRADQEGDTQDLINSVRNISSRSPLAFLSDVVDGDRIGLSGHSAGGVAVNALGSEPGVRAIMPMASGGTEAGDYLESTTVLGGMVDATASFATTTRAYNASPSPKRLIGFADMGHVGFVDICRGAELREQFGLELSGAINRLISDGCGEQFLPQESGWEMVNYVSTAAFEETLMCSTTAADSLRAFKDRYGNQHHYQEQLD